MGITWNLSGELRLAMTRRAAWLAASGSGLAEAAAGASGRHLDRDEHRVGKDNTQKIESKHINLRTRIKRLVRRTICFSKTERMHDLVIGLFINRYEFGRPL